MPKKRNSTPHESVSTTKIDKKAMKPKGKNFGHESSLAFDSARNSTINSAPMGQQISMSQDTSAMQNKKTKKVSSTIQKFLHKTANVGINKTFICCKESYIENPTSFYGCFYLGPFPESLSLTLSHNLRRTLLSEISGLAITAVEIDGVLHKYSNIPGIKETVLDILSNVQNIVFVKTRLANSFVAFLKVRGPGAVKASDIRLPAGVALVNPDQHIATLAEDGIFNMKIWIHEGKNAIKQKPQNPEESSLNLETSTVYGGTTTSLEEEEETSLVLKSGDFNQKTPSLNSNKLYLDSVFMPVTKVNSFVETNFKATDDPAKTAPFVFQTTSLVPEAHNQPDSNTTPQVRSAPKDIYQKNHRLNYFDFLSETAEINNPVNYLVLKSNMAEDTNFESNSLPNFDFSSTSHVGLPLNAPKRDVFAVDSQTSLIAKQSLLGSHPGHNPILMSPVTYNQPAKQCHIVLEIWTNGSIHPRQALKECLSLLAKTFIGLNNVKILGSMYKSHMTYQKILTDL